MRWGACPAPCCSGAWGVWARLGPWHRRAGGATSAHTARRDDGRERGRAPPPPPPPPLPFAAPPRGVGFTPASRPNQPGPRSRPYAHAKSKKGQIAPAPRARPARAPPPPYRPHPVRHVVQVLAPGGQRPGGPRRRPAPPAGGLHAGRAGDAGAARNALAARGRPRRGVARVRTGSGDDTPAVRSGGRQHAVQRGRGGGGDGLGAGHRVRAAAPRRLDRRQPRAAAGGRVVRAGAILEVAGPNRRAI
jgi:hypothetical protein